MHIAEQLKHLSPGRGGLTAGFFNGKSGRKIRVHHGGTAGHRPGRLRRGLQIFALAALVTGAGLMGWGSTAYAASPADQDVQVSVSETGSAVSTLPDVATDLDTSHSFSNGEGLIRRAAKDKQFIVFGDTCHGHAELRQFMALPGTVDALADAGVKKIILEMPDGLQPDVDAYMAGDLSRSAFIGKLEMHSQILLHDAVEGLQERVFNSVADIMDRARKHGMSVHFVNVLEMPDSVEDIAVEAEKAWKKHARANDVALDDFPAMVAFMTGFIQNKGQDTLSGIAKDIFKKRLEDKRRAKAMKKVAGDDKTAIFYGAGHFSNVTLDDQPRPKDLDEFLGQDKVVVINLHRDAQALRDYLASDHAGPDKPDHIYVIATDSVMPGNASAAPVQVVSTQPKR